MNRSATLSSIAVVALAATTGAHASAAARSSLPPDAVGAGAPWSTHFGIGGLCIVGDDFDWGTVPEGGVQLTNDVVYADAKSGVPTLLTVALDTLGTAGSRDDLVVFTLASFGVGEDTSTEVVVPKWTAVPGEIGGYTTANTHNTWYRPTVTRVELHGTTSAPTAVDNRTSLRMHATGRFDDAGGVNGFVGGSGDDCVEGSGSDDTISLGGGNDFARGGLGNDVLNGGSGGDTMEGSSGDDKFLGRAGRDLAKGGSGSDCYSDATDGERDVFVDGEGSSADADDYVAEPGLGPDGVQYDVTMDILTDPPLFYVEDCL